MQVGDRQSIECASKGLIELKVSDPEMQSLQTGPWTPASDLKKASDKFSIVGITLVILSIFAYTGSMMVVKQLGIMNPQITSFEILVSRSLVQLIIYELQMRVNWRKSSQPRVTYADFTGEEKRIIVFWVAIGFPAWMLLYYSMHVLPLGMVETIQNLTPFMTLLVGFYILQEGLKKLEVLNMVCSFGGVVFIITCSSHLSFVSEDIQFGPYLLGIVANGISAFIFAINNVIIRKLKHLDTVAVSAMHALLSLIFAVGLFLGYRLFVNPNQFVYNFTALQMAMILGNGLLITAGSYLYIKGFQLDKAGRASSIWFLAIVVCYGYDIVIFGYSMRWYEIAGSLIIVASSSLVFGMKLKGYSS